MNFLYSADQLALSSARAATSCSMMGQAAGIAAALCVQHRCGIRDPEPDQVRRTVIDRGGELKKYESPGKRMPPTTEYS